MFLDNVRCIIPLPLNWVWDASLVGKCELLYIIRITRYSAFLFVSSMGGHHVQQLLNATFAGGGRGGGGGYFTYQIYH